MKVHVIGGGPAGLYFATLIKKTWPATRITVFERNRPDDTFGFGVVFSDQTLDTFETYDRDSYRAIVGHFAYWDDIEIHFRGSTHRIGGNGFCGCSRATLLKILGRRARSLGVEIRYQSEVSPLDPAILDADLVVAADGINSRLRETFADQFKPSVDLRPNFFSWMGSTRPFDAFTFFFRQTEHGIFIAHCYQYEPQRSTWITETDPETFRRAGLDKLDEAASARFVERCSRPSSRATGSPPIARSGAIFRPSAASAGSPTTWCSSATPRRRRISRSARGPSWPWRTASHSTRLSAPPAAAMSRRRSRNSRPPARRGGEDPAFRRCLAGLVRARRSFLEHGPDPLRVRSDDALQGHHLRQPGAAGARIRGAGRSRGGTRGVRERLNPLALRLRLQGTAREGRGRCRRCSSRSGCVA